MSRIGKLPINIPAGVTVDVKDNVVTVKGPKGELSQTVNPAISVSLEEGQITFAINENSDVDQKQKQAFHGLYRALVNNMVVGVSEGYKKEMELVGVGYRVSNQGNLIEFSLGFTHSIFLQVPAEIKERELNLAREKAREAGKPENLIENIAQGALKKYYKDFTLLDQLFFIDNKLTVAQYLHSASKTLTATAFHRASLVAE